MGRVYYEGTLPRLVRALERIADALEAQNRTLPLRESDPPVETPAPRPVG
jgi:hypothetical protein